MKRLLAGLATLLFLPALKPSLAQGVAEPAAIVCMTSGRAFAKFEGRRTEIKLFQRLRSGASVETEADSKVVLALLTGDLYEFGEKASGIIRPRAIEPKKGVIQKLRSLPATIDLAPIARMENPGTRVAATRVRTAGTSILNLYPSYGAAAIAEATVLTFDSVEGYQRYQVDVEDKTGSTVFSLQTASAVVHISPGALRPGANYYWRVRTVDPEKPAVRGEAVFVTPREENASVRAALKEQAERVKDPALLALLAEVDFGLGLEREACGELKAALRETPGNRAIQETLIRFGCTQSANSAKK